jgi:2-C-methyl-D-erythritol 4-phosphate cytidylyltransferase
MDVVADPDPQGSTSFAAESSIAPMDGLVLTAAGDSKRFGTGTPKVLAELGGVPVLLRALDPFRAVLTDVVVAVTTRRADLDAVRALVGDARIVIGGASRQESVARAVAALPDDVDVIFVHDAARPLVTSGVIERVRDAARTDGAAACVVPVRDTLHRMTSEPGSSSALGPGVDRAGLARAQTPQAARATLLRRALARAEADGFEATDEVSLLLHDGTPVTAVAGTPTNIKITDRGDLALARLIIERRT